jgi:hypothetical protein
MDYAIAAILFLLIVVTLVRLKQMERRRQKSD